MHVQAESYVVIELLGELLLGKKSTLTKSYLEEVLREENRMVGKGESFSVSSPLLLGLKETATPLSFFISFSLSILIALKTESSVVLGYEDHLFHCSCLCLSLLPVPHS